MGASLSSFLLCLLIIIFGALILFFEFYVLAKLRQIYKSFDKIRVRVHSTNDEDEWIDDVGNVGLSTTVNVRYDRDELELNRGRFSVAYANYVTCGQLTSLLPLLGILGTVAGLIASSGTTDMSQMISGLGTAMWTTLCGLVASIGLKALDAVLLGRLVNLIDAKFNEADTIITRQTLQTEVRQARTKMTQVSGERAGITQQRAAGQAKTSKTGSGKAADHSGTKAQSGTQPKRLTDETQTAETSSQTAEMSSQIVEPAEQQPAKPKKETRITKVQTKAK
ncbi:MAG: MotA/TolQ/ExbB proton channel family protein [Lachnospiraceae bacterium]|nr:MotA/TolQ/ExbB proton channel family protein [Lachnospiraceae bacterium]